MGKRFGWTGVIAVLAACWACAARPSQMPLAGGSEPVAAEKTRDRRAAPGSDSPSAFASAGPSTTHPNVSETRPAASAPAAAAPGASTQKSNFRVLAEGESLSRATVFTFDLNVKVDEDPAVPNVSIHGNVRQELRYKLTHAKNAVPLEVELDYRSELVDMQVAGQTVDEPSVMHGQRYSVTNRDGKLSIRKLTGTSTTAEENDSARADTEEFLELQRTMVGLAAHFDGGEKSDQISAGLAQAAATGGESVKISERRVTFRRFDQLPSGERLALYDISFRLSFEDEDMVFSGTLSGTSTLGTAPWRVLGMKASGPATMQGAPGGEDEDINATGSMSLDVTYAF